MSALQNKDACYMVKKFKSPGVFHMASPGPERYMTYKAEYPTSVATTSALLPFYRHPVLKHGI